MPMAAIVCKVIGTGQNGTCTWAASAITAERARVLATNVTSAERGKERATDI